MFRQDNSLVTLTIDGRVLGKFESKTGGDSDSNTVQWQQAGMAGQISLGGTQMTANVVLSRLENDEVLGWKKWARSRTGRGVGTLTEQVLDDEGLPYGDPDIYDVVLKRAKGSDRNSNSNTAAEFEMELEVNGIPS